MRRLYVVALVACAPACRFQPAFNAGDDEPPVVDSPPGDTDAPPADAPPTDAPPDAPPPCFGTGLGVNVCLVAPPASPLTVTTNTTIMTGPSSAACATVTGPDADNYCVIAGTNVVVSATLRATGPRPLVIVSMGSITVAAAGTIDVASRRGGTAGAGTAPAALCPGTQEATTRGGGYGGSFGSTGGEGGKSTGGEPGPAIVPTTLRGGCAGGAGAAANQSTGGPGGGAVDLIAVGAIEINGTINASGAAGTRGPTANHGGAGGGAGGLIVFDAPTVMFGASARVFANGGGGGGGATFTVQGGHGNDPSGPTNNGTGGAGGSIAGAAGGGGGAGAHVSRTPGDGASGNDDNGGGGGGGGLGVIRVFQSEIPTGGAVSPAPL